MNKRKFVSEATGEPKTSSTALTLQQLNKQVETKEAAAESAKVRCRICFKETAPIPRCFGHGGGGGGGDGVGSGNTSEDKESLGEDKSLRKEVNLVVDTGELIAEFGSIEGSEGLGSDLDDKSFDPEVINELVNKGLLVIRNRNQLIKASTLFKMQPFQKKIVLLKKLRLGKWKVGSLIQLLFQPK